MIESKKGSSALLSDRDIRDENKRRYREILKTKVDPGSIMREAQEVAKILFSVFIDAASGSPEDFAKTFRTEHRWDGWNNTLGSIMTSLGQTLEKYTRDYAEYLKAAQEVADSKKDNPESEYISGKWQLENTLEQFMYHKKDIAKLKSQVDAM